MATVYLIDASPYIFRAYYALPTSIQSSAGVQTNAVYGFCDFLFQVIRKAEPSHIGVSFDGSLTTSFRNEIYPDYKMQRALPPEELQRQMQDCIRVTQALGMPTYCDDRFESDDLVGTLCAQLLAKDHSVVIISNDKDFAQLVTDRVCFWDYAKDVTYDRDGVFSKFGVHPERIVDLLALQGDSVDNIPGVKGVGPKTAKTLITHFGSLQNIFQNIDLLDTLPIRGAAAIKEKLIAHRHSAEMSYQLATISKCAPVQADLEILSYHGAERSELQHLFQEFGFSGKMARVPRWR